MYNLILMQAALNLLKDRYFRVLDIIDIHIP